VVVRQHLAQHGRGARRTRVPRAGGHTASPATGPPHQGAQRSAMEAGPSAASDDFEHADVPPAPRAKPVSPPLRPGPWKLGDARLAPGRRRESGRQNVPPGTSRSRRTTSRIFPWWPPPSKGPWAERRSARAKHIVRLASTTFMSITGSPVARPDETSDNSSKRPNLFRPPEAS